MTEKLLTPEQVAERLQVTERTVYRWLTEGRLKGVRLGRLWRIRPEAFDAFLRANTPSDPEASVDPGVGAGTDELPDEDRAWLEAGAHDLARALAEAESDIPLKELAAYLEAIRQRAVPVRWDPARGEFQEAPS